MTCHCKRNIASDSSIIWTCACVCACVCFCQVLMRPYHTYAMGHTALASLQAAFGCSSSSSNCSAVEVLENWENPRLRRPAAISDARLASLAAELNLVSVAATPFAVQWVTNTLANGDVRAPPHHT